MVIGSWHISINPGGGADLWAAPIPHFFFFTSGEVCLMTWANTAGFVSLWALSQQLGADVIVPFFTVTLVASWVLMSAPALMVPFDQTRVSVSFYVSYFSCISLHRNTFFRQKTHFTAKTPDWLHIWLTFISFLSFTGEAKSTALFFEPSYPSESTLASVGNSNRSLDTSL